MTVVPAGARGAGMTVATIGGTAVDRIAIAA